MNKVNRVNVCVLCAEIECKEHPELWRIEYQCNLCLFCHSLNRDADSCCLSMTDQTVVGEEFRQKPSKRVAKPSEYYPTEAVKRARGR